MNLKTVGNQTLSHRTAHAGPRKHLRLIAAVESSDLDLNDIATIDTDPYCLVCMDHDYQTSHWSKIKDLKEFGCSLNRNCNSGNVYEKDTLATLPRRGTDIVKDSDAIAALLNEVIGNRHTQVTSQALHRKVVNTDRVLCVAVVKVY